MSAGEQKRVLFVLTSNDRLGETGNRTGAFLSEVAHPYKEIREAGYSVDFVSPKGGEIPFDPRSLDDPDADSESFYADQEIRDRLRMTLRPSEVDPNAYDGIFYAGGHGTMWDLPEDAGLARLCAEIYEAGGVVGAVCHGPAGLVNVRLSDGSYLVSGRQVSSFTTEEEQAVGLEDVVPFLLDRRLEERGASHVKADKFQEKVVRDGRLVTGQNPQSAAAVGRAMAEVLKELESQPA